MEAGCAHVQQVIQLLLNFFLFLAFRFVSLRFFVLFFVLSWFFLFLDIRDFNEKSCKTVTLIDTQYQIEFTIIRPQQQQQEKREGESAAGSALPYTTKSTSDVKIFNYSLPRNTTTAALHFTLT